MKVQEFLTGYGCRHKIAETALMKNARKILVVCDYAPVLKEIREALDRSGAERVVFSDFTANPKYEDLAEGAALFRREGCDTLLSVGGGSAMDTAKAIKLLCGENGEPAPVPHMAVPTTAGTGSESTHFAVLYRNGEKESADHPDLLPDYAVLDPFFLKTLPDYQKKSTLMDAVCQAVESFWSKRHSDDSRAFSLKALGKILPNIDAYVAGDETAAEAVMMGANYSGRAIDRTTTTAPHAMSYKLSSLFGAAHGHAVSLVFPGVLRATAPNLDPAEYAEIFRLFGVSDFEALAARFDAFNERFGFTLKAKPDETQLDELTRSVNVQRLSNHPVPLTEEQIRAVYRDL